MDYTESHQKQPKSDRRANILATFKHTRPSQELVNKQAPFVRIDTTRHLAPEVTSCKMRGCRNGTPRTPNAEMVVIFCVV